MKNVRPSISTVTFTERLQRITRGCRPDMHEPDEQQIKVRIVGDHLDNACGDFIGIRQIVEGFQEYVVVIERVIDGQFEREQFNLATLIAHVRRAQDGEPDAARETDV